MNLRLTWLGSLVPLLLCAAASAQMGAVSGHVTCADTNAPARLADITLMPVPEKVAPGEKAKPAPPMTIYKTGLDGRFTLAGIRPGRYYVVVQKAGYLVPESQFTEAEITNPSDEVQAQIARVMPQIEVRAGQVTQAEVRLIRAASISGTVRFDDGTPFDEKFVAISRKGRDGKWIPLNRVFEKSHGAGDYVLLGLAAGEYRLSTSMIINDRVTDSLFGLSGTTAYVRGYGLTMYDGDTFKAKDAKTITVKDGESVVDHDLTIPVAKLHTVSGSVVEARTGRAVNSGTITLMEDDGSELTEVQVRKEDATFSFPFVPEGTYTAKVTEAKELARELLPPGKTAFEQMVPHYKETTLRSFADTAVPLIVQTDVTGVALAVTAKAAGKE